VSEVSVSSLWLWSPTWTSSKPFCIGIMQFSAESQPCFAI
jgi:hypothetical protein